MNNKKHRPLTVNELWNKLEVYLQKAVPLAADPAEMHNLKSVYFQGMNDMLQLQILFANHMPEAEAVIRSRGLLMELETFFVQCSQSAFMEDLHRRHYEYEQAQIAALLGAAVLEIAEPEEEKVPLTKAHLH